MFGGPRQKGSWRPLHPRSRVYFPGLNLTPSDIIRFPPRVPGLFRTQPVMKIYMYMQENYFMHDKFRVENESTDTCTSTADRAGRSTDPGFRGEGGGDATGKDTCIRLPPARMSGYGPWGSGA